MRSSFRVTRFDLLNTSVSALRDGVSSLYGLYLVNGLGLGPIQIGQILSAATAASLLGQVPLGYLYDRIQRKGLVVAAGAIGMAVAALIIGVGTAPSFAVAFAAQLLFGLSMSTLSAGMPALTVALTRDRDLGNRLVRNEVFSKFGNLSTLAAASWLASALSLRIIFVMIPVLALPVVWLAVAAPAPPRDLIPPRVTDTLSVRREAPQFYWFVAMTFLFFLTSSAALPLFEQVFGPLHSNGGSSWIASAAILTMGTVTLTIVALSKVVGARGLVTMLSVTFGLMALRLGVLSGGALVGVLMVGQLLDGVIDGILVTVPTRWLAMRYRQGFAVRSGFLGSVASLGAFASTMSSGPLMAKYGYPYCMVAYVAPALLGLGITLFARRTLVG